MKFIELTSTNGEPMAIRLNLINYVTPYDRTMSESAQTSIFLNDGTVLVSLESTSEVISKLKD